MNRFCFILFCTFLPIMASAQKKGKVAYSFSKVNDIVIDADLKDWGDNLQIANGDLFSFGISERNGELFVAIMVKDQELIRDAFRAGLFVNVNYDEKKKDGARLYFPYWDRERKKALANDEEMQKGNMEQAFLNNINGYLVIGFGKVRDGLLAINNDYGIDAKVHYQKDKALIYEARIPLDLVGVKSNKIAVQLGVTTQYNLLKKASENQYRRNMSPLMGRPLMHSTLKNPYKGDTDVWVIDIIEK